MLDNCTADIAWSIADDLGRQLGTGYQGVDNCNALHAGMRLMWQLADWIDEGAAEWDRLKIGDTSVLPEADIDGGFYLAGFQHDARCLRTLRHARNTPDLNCALERVAEWMDAIGAADAAMRTRLREAMARGVRYRDALAAAVVAGRA